MYTFLMQHKFKWNVPEKAENNTQNIHIENMNISKLSEDDLDEQIKKKLKQLKEFTEDDSGTD